MCFNPLKGMVVYYLYHIILIPKSGSYTRLFKKIAFVMHVKKKIIYFGNIFLVISGSSSLYQYFRNPLFNILLLKRLNKTSIEIQSCGKVYKVLFQYVAKLFLSF